MRNVAYGESGGIPNGNVVPKYLQAGEIDLRGINYFPDYLPMYPKDIDSTDNHSRRQIVVPVDKTLYGIISEAVTGLGTDLTILSLKNEEAYMKVGITARFITSLVVGKKPETGLTKESKLVPVIVPTKKSKLVTVSKQPGHSNVVSTQQQLHIAEDGNAYTLVGKEGYEVQKLHQLPLYELNNLVAVNASLDELRALGKLDAVPLLVDEALAREQQPGTRFSLRALVGSLSLRN